MSKKVLLIGCGQLGSRHLQALACMDEISRIDVVEISPESIVLGKERLKGLPGVNTKISIQWHASLNDIRFEFDLCVVATSARGRVELVKALIERGCKRFILEKIVAQSTEDYDDLLRVVEASGVKAWVDMPTRAFQIHKYIKNRLSSGEPITFIEAGGNWGLACNGIHYIDLFVYYDESSILEPEAFLIDPLLHSSKRGEMYKDLSGVICGRSDKGSRIILSYAKDHKNADVVSIFSTKARFMVDIVNGWAQEEMGDGQWRRIDIQENIYVSHTTKIFVRDIFKRDCCELPSLRESRISHLFLLDNLQAHFNRLSGQALKYCPTT